MENLLKQKRKEKGLTQNEAANGVGMLMHAYQKLECGRNKTVSLERARLFAKLFDCSIEDIFPDENA